MNTIFLVVERVEDGVDDSENETLLFVTPNNDLADIFIEEEQTKNEKLSCLVGKIEDFECKWRKDNPFPQDEITHFPKKCTKVEIQIIIERNKAILNEWSNRLLKAKQEFLISIDQSPDLIKAISACPGKVVYYKKHIEYRE